MTHVGVERLGAGHRQHDRAEIDEGEPLVRHDELDRIVGRQRAQDLGIVRDLVGAERGQDEEPETHDRAEHAADLPGPAHLHPEQDHDDDHGDRDDDVVELRIDDLQALDGGEHRDRRGDDAVAKEQARAGDADQSEQMPGAGAGGAALRERHQRQDAALAIVVGAQDQQHVFDRDRQDQRVEHQR